MGVFYSVVFYATLASVLANCEPASEICRSGQPHLISELQELKLKAADLESILDQSTKHVNAKSIDLMERQELLEEMTKKIHLLQSALSNLKEDSLHAEPRLSALEEEVKNLWAASRKNNFDLHILESKVQDAEDRLKEVTLRVEKMADIVTEQWIQIQHLEQALVIAKKRAEKAQRQLWSRCTFLKFINNISGHHVPKLFERLYSELFGEESTLNSCMAFILEQMRRLFAAARDYHHQLQRLIKQEIERNGLPAPLAHEEVVFFVASALITFPILSIWMLLSS